MLPGFFPSPDSTVLFRSFCLWWVFPSVQGLQQPEKASSFSDPAELNAECLHFYKQVLYIDNFVSDQRLKKDTHKTYQAVLKQKRWFHNSHTCLHIVQCVGPQHCTSPCRGNLGTAVLLFWSFERAAHALLPLLLLLYLKVDSLLCFTVLYLQIQVPSRLAPWTNDHIHLYAAFHFVIMQPYIHTES